MQVNDGPWRNAFWPYSTERAGPGSSSYRWGNTTGPHETGKKPDVQRHPDDGKLTREGGQYVIHDTNGWGRHVALRFTPEASGPFAGYISHDFFRNRTSGSYERSVSGTAHFNPETGHAFATKGPRPDSPRMDPSDEMVILSLAHSTFPFDGDRIYAEVNARAKAPDLPAPNKFTPPPAPAAAPTGRTMTLLELRAQKVD